jgi:hypothetical protein
VLPEEASLPVVVSLLVPEVAVSLLVPVVVAPVPVPVVVTWALGVVS